MRIIAKYKDCNVKEANFTWILLLRNFTSCYELGIILRKGYVNKLGVNLVRSSLKNT